MTVKEVQLGGRDPEKEMELANVARRYNLCHEPGNECAMTILYGYGLSDNRLLYIVCPPAVCRYAILLVSVLVVKLDVNQLMPYLYFPFFLYFLVQNFYVPRMCLFRSLEFGSAACAG